MFRLRNVHPNSALGELRLQTFLNVLAVDYGQIFVFPRAEEVRVMEVGLAVESHTGLTEAHLEIAYPNVGLVGTESLIDDDGTLDAAFTTILNDNATAFDVNAAGWMARRADPALGQEYLCRVVRGQGEGQNAFDDFHNLALRLAIGMTGASALNDYAWMNVRVFYPEDK